MKNAIKIFPLIAAICILFCSCSEVAEIESNIDTTTTTTAKAASKSISVDDIPQFSDTPYVEINNNEPDFESSEITTESYEEYGELDSLGRCTTAEACIGTDIMPTEERGSIGSVKPTGWHTVKYKIVDGKYLYNRCHLIGYQLTGENANERNLITGTRYLNINGMLPFEDETADYVRSSGNHVMYKVTPIFEGNELVAKGVHIMAYSVEDNGEGVSFNVFCYNSQPGIEIDYATGDSKLSSESYSEEEYDEDEKQTFVVNLNTRKFHKPDCSGIENIKDENKKTYNGYRKNLIDNGYTPCGKCNP